MIQEITWKSSLQGSLLTRSALVCLVRGGGPWYRLLRPEAPPFYEEDSALNMQANMNRVLLDTPKALLNVARPLINRDPRTPLRDPQTRSKLAREHCNTHLITTLLGGGRWPPPRRVV